MIIYNPNIKDAPQACILYAVPDKFDVLKVTLEDVYRETPVEYYLEHMNCSSIDIVIIWANDIIYNYCGYEFDAIKFVGEGFRGKDFMYALSRLRPQIKLKSS